MRSTLLVALIAPLLLLPIACGNEKSELLDEDSGAPAHSGPSNQSGTDAGCPGEEPPCDTACPGEPVQNTPAQCVNGIWQCLGYGTVCETEDAGPPDDASPPDDGGPECGSSPPPGFYCPAPCSGAWGGYPSCDEGTWSCNIVECIPDGSVLDSDPPPPGLFACGDIACDPASSYCQIDTGGAVPDGSAYSGYSCQPLPASCSGVGTCGCALPDAGLGSVSCDCLAQGSDVIVTCTIP
jgi:hypothetical protein